MRNVAARSERSAVRAVVDEVLSCGAFLLMDHNGLWIYNSRKVPPKLQRKARLMRAELFEVLALDPHATPADDAGAE